MRIETTGWGDTTTFHHEVWCDLEGNECPVIGYRAKGYKNAREVFQIVPDSGWIVRHVGSDNPRVDDPNSQPDIILFGEVDLPCLSKLLSNGTQEKLQVIAREVGKWRSGRCCHFPPITAEEPLHRPRWSFGTIRKEARECPGLFDEWNVGRIYLPGDGHGCHQRGFFVSRTWPLSLDPGKFSWHEPGFTTNRIGTKDSPFTLAHHRVDIISGSFLVEGRYIEDDRRCEFACWTGGTPRNEELKLLVTDLRTGEQTQACVIGEFRIGHYVREPVD